MARIIEELSDKEIENFVRSYKREDKVEGGIFSLAQLQVEKLRRLPSMRSPREVTKFIIETASESSSGTMTYGEVWKFLSPGKSWKGNHSVKIVGNSLGAAIAYCIRHNLPLVSTLVVQAGSRKLSQRAIQAIYDDAKLYGLDVRVGANEFVDHQAQIARDFRTSDLP